MPYYSVVVASRKDLAKAKSVADEIAEKDSTMMARVACRRPGNDYYPVVIGKTGTQMVAEKWKMRFEATKIRQREPYLSYYTYRAPIYIPNG